MPFEIDFLPVGDGEKSGDAIAMRYSTMAGSQRVVVIDGGYIDDGEALVEHIGRYYRTDIIDVMVNTHPDDNHVRGLIPVVEKLHVGELWMHRPWDHTSELPSGLDPAVQLFHTATERGVTVREPFAGVTTPDGCFSVLGPTAAFYEEQLEQFDPSAVEAALLTLSRGVDTVATKVRETFWNELLMGAKTTARNNSSAITQLTVDGETVLFTGDAGLPALTDLLDRLEPVGFQAGSFDTVQVPHHGSRRNVSTDVLDRLLGPIGRSGGSAVVSCAQGSDKHPSRRVTNAFLRRGYPVVATNGRTICSRSSDMPWRPGWEPVEPLPFYEEVEDDPQ